MTPFDDSNNDTNLEHNIFENHVFNDQEYNKLPESIETKLQITEVADPLLRRVGNSYQILAAAIIRATQSKRELQARIAEAQQQIEHNQQRLTQISEQIIENQVDVLPKDEYSAYQQLATMNSCIREKHYNNLANHLTELSQAEHHSLPTIIDSMRAELDLIEALAQKIKILENLKEAYKNQRYFQDYYQQADEEFKKLLNQY
ncbi:hypothetical protein [uncultured Thiothrix sp.]|jgi:hypothetical protein|uniref:hypothetical protein n=1 Tax=uncultured Thiothrix sp. TaxID=223185 RepID=UPI002608E268|nr:hypothetical protein [uncultured Thiothrix sp.]HMT92528.1 hypothetical protein [Thiolinea sp.]